MNLKEKQEPENPFDIVNARFSINSETKKTEYAKNLLFVGGYTYGWDFDEITVVVKKSDNDIYLIEFTLVHNGKTIKGKYVGEMEVVDNWK